MKAWESKAYGTGKEELHPRHENSVYQGVMIGRFVGLATLTEFESLGYGDLKILYKKGRSK